MTANEPTRTGRIEGKVAGVLTIRELVINRGSADGVEIGMRFAVLNRQGINVKDPDTGQPLGSAEIAKAIVKVVRIDDEHLCTARTFRTTGGTPGIAAIAALTGTPARVETLSIKGAALKEELNPEDSYVKVGDPVVETTGDEYDDL